MKNCSLTEGRFKNVKKIWNFLYNGIQQITAIKQSFLLKILRIELKLLHNPVDFDMT